VFGAVERNSQCQPRIARLAANHGGAAGHSLRTDDVSQN
jgi:hypothetical protein